MRPRPAALPRRLSALEALLEARRTGANPNARPPQGRSIDAGRIVATEGLRTLAPIAAPHLHFTRRVYAPRCWTGPAPYLPPTDTDGTPWTRYDNSHTYADLTHETDLEPNSAFAHIGHGSRGRDYLLARLADACGLPPDLGRVALDTIAGAMVGALASGRRISITGFGSLTRAQYSGKWSYSVWRGRDIYVLPKPRIVYRPIAELYGPAQMGSRGSRATQRRRVAEEREGRAWLQANQHALDAEDRYLWEQRVAGALPWNWLYPVQAKSYEESRAAARKRERRKGKRRRK